MSSDMDKQQVVSELELSAEQKEGQLPEPSKDIVVAAVDSAVPAEPDLKTDAVAVTQPLAAPDKAAAPKKGAKKEVDPKAKGWFRETVELVLMTLFLLAVIRSTLAEARYIPSGSMEPTLQINDRILVEKVSGWMARPIERGDILVFYPPPIEMGGKDINHSFLYELGRLTGLPCFPIDTAYIKRVVGLPGDVVKVQKGVGVFIDDQLLPETYVKECPDYDLKVLGDIGGHNTEGQFIKPYGDSNEPIYVKPNQLFMMGDNRNNSGDSHVWGLLDRKRVIGKSCLLFWRWLPEQQDQKLVQPSADMP